LRSRKSSALESVCAFVSYFVPSLVVDTFSSQLLSLSHKFTTEEDAEETSCEGERGIKEQKEWV